jgi:hypothetical protein
MNPDNIEELSIGHLLDEIKRSHKVERDLFERCVYYAKEAGLYDEFKTWWVKKKEKIDA